jgi:hypothetical protein
MAGFKFKLNVEIEQALKDKEQLNNKGVSFLFIHTLSSLLELKDMKHVPYQTSSKRSHNTFGFGIKNSIL